MPKLLTVAIPTYQRAARLDRQLGWLSRSLGEHGAANSLECDVIVSDNASSDDTVAVCEKWQNALAARGVTMRINRNTANVGPLPNIARCMELADTRFVWVIGDDDEIPDDKLGFVISILKRDPDLASIVLNFEGVGKTVYQRCFDLPHDLMGDGRDVMSECLSRAYFGLAFMTAQVYRTEFVRAALKAWPEGRKNYDYQIFLTAYAGSRGRAIATHDTHVKYVTGDNVYEKNKRIGMSLYADSLEVFARLAHIGFARDLCRSLAWKHVWGLKKRFLKGAVQVNPLITLVTSMRVTGYLACLEVGYWFRPRKVRPVTSQPSTNMATA